MKVIERGDDFRGDAKFSTWLYTIARNLSIDHQRKMKFRGHASLDATQPRTGQSIGERLGDPGPSTERLAIGGRIRARIGEAVEELPQEQREVFLLRQLHGLAFKEIAEIVGVSSNTVKSRMRYALERLRSVLGDLEESDEL
jgi:RNA polymerase sigma-70 factor (ECF subfamily)